VNFRGTASEDLLGLAALGLFAGLWAAAPDWVLADFAIYFAYAILAVSLAFAWGHVGLLSLGHAVYFGVGAYAMSLVTLGLMPGLPQLHSTWLGVVTAVVAAGGTAWLFGTFFFAARGLRGAFLGIVTLALAVIFERAATNSTWLGGLNGLMNVPPIRLGLNGDGAEVYEPTPLYWIALALLAVVVVGLRLVQASPFGLALAALRENELRLWTLGRDVRRLKTRAFALSGAVAGLAGALFVTQFGFASPSLIGFSLSADVLIWVALGGRGALVASALGAILARFVESRLSGSLGAFWPLALGGLFMACVVLFPRGIIGEGLARLDDWRGQGRDLRR